MQTIKLFKTFYKRGLGSSLEAQLAKVPIFDKNSKFKAIWDFVHLLNVVYWIFLVAVRISFPD